MTYTLSHTARRAPLSALHRIGDALSDILSVVAAADPRSTALDRLARTTDADLAARGTSRVAELRRIVGIQPF